MIILPPLLRFPYGSGSFILPTAKCTEKGEWAQGEAQHFPDFKVAAPAHANAAAAMREQLEQVEEEIKADAPPAPVASSATAARSAAVHPVARRLSIGAAGWSKSSRTSPHPVLTITLGSGVEFRAYKDIEWDFDATFYFAPPRHAWERGTNENTNGLIRQRLNGRTKHDDGQRLARPISPNVTDEARPSLARLVRQ